MATLTIRNVPDSVKQNLRVRAARDGRSLEESLRLMLADQADGTGRTASRIDASEIMRRAEALASDPPRSARFAYLTQKELSDAICGEFDDI